jgi:Diguanylate cyclase, GGDEF domain
VVVSVVRVSVMKPERVPVGVLEENDPVETPVKCSRHGGNVAIFPAMSSAQAWLCPTPSHRNRFLDMQERLRTARAATIVVGAVLAAAMSIKAGWPMMIAGAVMIAVVVIGASQADRRRKPELWVFATTALNTQLWLGVGIVLSGGPRTALPSMLAIPVLMVTARFSSRGLIVGAPISGLLVLVTTVGFDPAYVLARPESMLVPLSVVLCTALYAAPLAASDIRHRADSSLDELTGLLNRRALVQRLAELTEQAVLVGEPVSAVVADLDHFKRINDLHGHTTRRRGAHGRRRGHAPEPPQLRAAVPRGRRGVRPSTAGREGARLRRNRGDATYRHRAPATSRAPGDLLVWGGDAIRRRARAREPHR